MSEFDAWLNEEEPDTDREVGGIVYRLAHTYADKGMAQTEAYFQRENNNYFARAMRVNVGDQKGKWGTYVSRSRRGE